MSRNHHRSLMLALSVMIFLAASCNLHDSSLITTPSPEIQQRTFDLASDKAGDTQGLSIGELHNALLDKMDNKHKLFGDGQYKDNDAFALDFANAANEVIEDYGLVGHVEPNDVQCAICSLDSLVDLGIMTWPELGTTEPEVLNPDALFSGMVQRNLLTSEQANWCEGLYLDLNSLNDPDGDEIHEEIIAYGVQNGWPVPKSPAAVYLNLLLNSNQYWGSPEKSQIHDIGLIVYDTTGGIIGLEGGPIWSFIIGAAFSISYAETNPDAPS